ncbi:hypothetical protein [Halomicronema sp. CCY15110]|uniref:hypothetical protein n=1 Tax=Halomicronema sp. CCY15110 TaxID=2767773 RepID=UPI00194F61DB|nr:hypothetical protein [Halomicronema sp. CCY15110]
MIRPIRRKGWGLRRRRQPWWWGGIVVAIALLVAVCTQVNLVGEGRQIRLWQRPDGTAVTDYAAGDEFLTAAFTLLEDYWQDIRNENPDLVRGHLDHYLPPELKTLNYEPADALMREFAEAFFTARHAQTGLIPYAYDTPVPGDPHRPAEADLTSGAMQPVGLIARAMEFCLWFPADRALQNQCRALARNTIEHFDVPAESAQPHGLWGWVNVASDRARRSSLTLIQDYGEVAWGMAQLSQQTGDPYFAQWADTKLQFVWQHPMSADLPILHEQFVLTQALDRPEEPSSDTDTLYFVRRLYDLYDLTQTPQYRDWALAVTDLWCDRAWNSQWGHFIRKLNPDGTPAVDTLYGDGKYNTLAMLVRAYQVTDDVAYLEQLKLAWNNLVRLGQNGLAPEAVRQGLADREAGLDPEQTIFLDILVEAYKASGDRAFLQAAETLGRAILQQGPSVMRHESGQAGHAFLKLALARQPIHRVELTLTQPHTPLQIERTGHPLLRVMPPTANVVVYRPRGPEAIVTSASGQLATKVTRP